MRSAALGVAMQDLGATVTLVTTCDTPPLLEQIARLHLEVKAVGTPMDHADLVVFDGYHFAESDLAAARAWAGAVGVIDDTARLSAYAADILLDHNIGALRQPYRTPRSARLVLGPSFSLLRPQFNRAGRRERAVAAPRGIILCGGADAVSASVMVAEAAMMAAAPIEWTVVAGAASANAEALGQLAASYPRLSVRYAVDDVAALMAGADLAVAAVGGTMWELACLGVPALLFGTTGTHARIGEQVAEYGAHRWLGLIGTLTPPALAAAIDELWDDADGRANARRLGMQLIDGRGASRAADAMLRAATVPAASRQTECVVREANAGDAEAVWEIAGDPEVRRQSFSTGSFPFPAHECWFNKKLASPDVRFFVADEGGVVAGFARFEREEAAAKISVATASPFQGRGIARRLLAEASPLASDALSVSTARGFVLEQNHPSRRLFLAAGFSDAGVRVVSGQTCRVFERQVPRG